MKYLITLLLFVVWSTFMYQQGYKSCRLEFVEISQTQYEETIKKLIAAREAVAAQAQAYRVAADSVRADAQRLSNELAAAQSRLRDKSTATPADSCRWSPKMESVIKGATDLITERDMIALQYNQLREQCHLR